MASNTYNPTRSKLSQVTVIGDAGVDAIIQLIDFHGDWIDPADV